MLEWLTALIFRRLGSLALGRFLLQFVQFRNIHIHLRNLQLVEQRERNRHENSILVAIFGRIFLHLECRAEQTHRIGTQSLVVLASRPVEQLRNEVFGLLKFSFGK